MARPSILIVDDQEEVRDAFSRSLALDRYDVRTADTADRAMQLVEAREPDAILLDLVMPKVNGVAFLHRLREGHPRIPVAVITGKSDVDEATVREILTLDADIRFKPISLAHVREVTRDLLTRPPRSDSHTDDLHARARHALTQARKAADLEWGVGQRARQERDRRKR